MDDLIRLLKTNALASRQDLADQLDLSLDEVNRKIAELEESGVIIGYHAVVDEEKLADSGRVTAFIEVRVTPERGGGFDKLAERIAKFEHVDSLYLMSGAYDILVIVKGATLKEVSSFVAHKLSTLEGVVQTATHFQLKAYKEAGFLATRQQLGERLAVTP